jgi:hypothetical protein
MKSASLFSRIRRSSSNPKSKIPNPQSSDCRPRLIFERLEDRTVLSSFAVTFGGAGDDYPRPAGATDPQDVLVQRELEF